MHLTVIKLLKTGKIYKISNILLHYKNEDKHKGSKNSYEKYASQI